MNAQRSGWRNAAPWLFLLASLLGAVYSCSGVVMSASFTVSTLSPAQSAYWRKIAIRYEWITLLFVLLSATAVVVLIRRWRRAA